MHPKDRKLCITTSKENAFVGVAPRFPRSTHNKGKVSAFHPNTNVGKNKSGNPDIFFVYD